MGVLISVIMLMTSVFLMKEADHDCTSENCPICEIILQCERTVHEIGSVVALTMLICISVLAAVSIFSMDPSEVSYKTLIDLKIRLDN